MTDVPQNPPSGDHDRRSRLLGVKLRALVVEHLGADAAARVPARTTTYPHGAALVVDGSAWVLLDGPAARALGGALAWALRHGATSLHLVADHDTGVLARRAEQLTFPVSVWYAQERTLLPAVAEPLAPAPPASSEHLDLTSMIVAAGADPNIEHGVVFGEVRGLEVCRVVDQPTTGHFAELGDVGLTAAAAGADALGVAAAGVQLEVGVGANDREAFRLLHGDIPTVEALGSVVDAVATHRSPDAPQHPLNRLAKERFLRWRLEQEPALVGAATVTPAEPPSPRQNLKDPLPCVARGVDADGQATTIVCSSGVDLDLVGFVADVQRTSSAPVIVAAPERDLIPIARELLDQLRTPVTVVAVG